MDTSLKTGRCQCERSSNWHEDYRCDLCAEEDRIDEIGQAECEHLEYLERIYTYAATEERIA